MKKFNLKSMAIGAIVGIGLITSAIGASTLVGGNVYISTFPIMLNGKSYTTTSKILNYGGTTYVPLRELATITGSEVNFEDNTIYIDNDSSAKPATTPSTATTPTTTPSTGKLNPTTTFTQQELDVGKTYTATVNLQQHAATKAVVSTTDSCVKLSQTSYTATGLVTITAKESGKATVKVQYDTGDIEYIYITIKDDESEKDYEIKVGESATYKVDLDDFDADKATVTITEGTNYVEVNKTSFTSNGNLKVTGKKVGDATVRVKYDSGDIIYLYVTVKKSSGSSSSDSDKDFEIEVGSYKNYTVNLKQYDADEAKVTIMSGSTYVTLSKTTFTSSGTLKITGKKAGEAKIRVKYDTDDTEYIYVTVTDDEGDLEVNVGSSKSVTIDLDEYDADEATVSITSGSSYITLNKTSFTSNGTLKITGKKAGESTVKVKYDSGDTQSIYVTVVDDDDDEYDYEDKLTISVDDYDYIYVDLDYYDADSATLKILEGSDCITLAKTSVENKNTKVKVTGDEKGEAIVRVKYDSGDTEYFYVKVK